MRSLFCATLVLGLMGATVHAQDAPPPAPFAGDDLSEAAIKQGFVMLEEAQKAYRTAPVITESIKITIATPSGAPQEQAMTSAWGPNGTFQILMNDGDVEISSNGTKVFFASSDSPDQFIAEEVNPDDPMEAFMKITNGGGMPDPAAGFRLGKPKKSKELPSLLSMGALQNVKVTGARIADGVPQLMLSGDGGTNIISFDPKTSLIAKSIMSFTPPGAPPEFKLVVSFAFNPKIHTKLPKSIAFVVGDRKQVDSMEELGPQPVAVGEKAPTFTLATLQGDNVSLEDLKGSIVVLDFWATWCGPCRKGLPELEKVAKWVAEEGLPIKIFGVDVWENGTAEARMKTAGEFWAKQGFSFPTLMDLDDSVVGTYGISGIPATFIIGRDGTIIGYHGGFDPNMAETLKKELKEAVQENG